LEFWESRALDFELPKGKVLAIGHILPAANEKAPLLQLIQENPQLAPDLTIDLPVQSPMTGEKVMANAIIP
jgi:hypothetical protein